MLIASFLIVNFAFAKKTTDFPSQNGIGSADTFVAHKRTVYRFLPDNKKWRMVKFVPKSLGYRKGLPEDMETFLAKALKEKSRYSVTTWTMEKARQLKAGKSLV